jgi:Protein of unknown function (DUF4242)
MSCIIVESTDPVAVSGPWIRRYVASDLSRVICELDAPDLATAIDAYRAAGVTYDRAYPCFKYEAITSTNYARSRANIEPLPQTVATIMIVTDYDPPLTDEDNDQMSQRVFACLAAHGAAWVRSFLATDRTRMVCEFQAHDSETLRLVMRTANVQLGRTWKAEVSESVR